MGPDERLGAMSQAICCVCEKPGVSSLGQRSYCEEHFAVVNKPHPGFWRAALVQIVGMVILTAVVAGLTTAIGPLAGSRALLLT